METPSSTRRVTRSQTSALKSNTNSNIPISKKTEETEKNVSKSVKRSGKQQQDRSALIDITNDSPIVGVATGSLETPSSNMGKQRSNRAKMTPGSGEALLRGQVKTLLQKVEEEAELSKLSLDGRRFLHLHGFVPSPSGLLAPTPANTPQISNLSDESGDSNSLASLLSSCAVTEEDFMISEVLGQNVVESEKQQNVESEKNWITRSLLLDFSEKSVSSECSSELTFGGESEGNGKLSTDDDGSSVWSIQVNASSNDDDEEGAIEEEEEEEYYDDEDEYDEEEVDGGWVDDLCSGINKMSVSEKITSKFTGKHKRFVYDSDGEIVGEEEVCGEDAEDFAAVTPNVMLLKGFPTPKGKHLRFLPQEEE